MTPATALQAPLEVRARRPMQRSSPPAVCAIVGFIPRPCARRHARHCLRAATTILSGWVELPRSRRCARIFVGVAQHCAPLAKTLKLNGYNTAQFGKCHEVPVWQTSPVGPFDQWPTGGGGFEYFYGFIGGEAHQWYPSLYEGTTPIEVRRRRKRGITSWRT